MSLQNISWFSSVCGMERKTILKRIENMPREQNGRETLFESKDALPLIYGVSNGGAQGELSRERAMLAQAQRKKIELETAVLKADVIPSEVVKEVWSQLLSACRARLLAMPSRMATQLMTVKNHTEIEEITRDFIYEALNELAEFQAEQYRSKRARAAHLSSSDEDIETATEVDSEPVGESKPVPKPRRQRRAGQV